MIIIYLLAAGILWCFLAHCVLIPCCTCRKRPQKIRYTALNHNKGGWQLNGAHRGGSNERPENTTEAFRNAMSLGLNLMECDVHLSKDGEVVIAHDNTLERMCGNEYVGKRVADYNFADLPKFQQNIPLHMQTGAYSLQANDLPKFTLLRDLFAISEGVFISIDMKDSDDQLCFKVDEMVREFKREDLTFWGSMFAEQHATVQRLNPRVACFYSGKQVITTYLWWILGCIWCCQLPSDAFMTAQFTKRNIAMVKEMLASRGRTSCFYGCFMGLARLLHISSASLFRHLRARNVTTVMWVMNHQEEFTELKELYGPSLMGVMTDRPTVLKKFCDDLEKQGPYN